MIHRDLMKHAKVNFVLSVAPIAVGVILCALVIVSFSPIDATAQTYLEVFGQNRVQYRKFKWQYFDTKHFRIYFYDRTGKELGRYVAEEAENEIPVVEKKLGGEFPKRFNIVLYNSYDEYRQTNIGLKEESALTGNSKAGSVNLVGEKLVVYFTGQHADLRHQVLAGMARIGLEHMQKKIKAALENLPQWVGDGYISYIVDGWDARSNSEWKGLLDARPDAGFNELSEQHPELAGKAFWKYVSSEYSPNMVKNLLADLEKKTSLNKAMKDKANLGMKVRVAYDSCIAFYKGVYARDAQNQEQPDSTKGLISLKVPKDNTDIKNIMVSPRGSDVSYIAWRDGKFTVYEQKTSHEQELSILFEGGQKDLTEQTDPNYPMMAWSNTGYKLAILYRKGFHTYLLVYNSLAGRVNDYEIPANRFDRVLGMTFLDDDDHMIFSAIKKSQTDLYMFTFKGSKMTNITDDVWDDVSPVFVNGGSRTGILFLSNRPKPNMDVPLGVNEMPTGPMNVFFYNTKTMRRELMQCSNVKTGHVTNPIQYGFDNFAYLYDANGINNKYVVLFARDKHNMDSAYSVPITNYPSSILSQQYNVASGGVADVLQVKDKYMVYFHDLQMPGVNTAVKTLSPTILSQEKPDANGRGTHGGESTSRRGKYSPNIDEEPVEPELKSGNAFQTEFTDTAATPKKRKSKSNNIFNANAANDSSTLSVISDSTYFKLKPANYRLSFKPDFFSINLENSLLFNQYQSIASNGGQYQNPSLGALTTLSLDELLENQRITAGFQLPISTPGSTYFLQYQNFTKRLDWGLLFLRSTNKQTIPVGYTDPSGNVILVQDQLFKTITNLVQSDFSYPLDRVRSIRFHTALRQDVLVEKATDTLSLTYRVPNSANYTSQSRLEYVFDNTITPAMNILNGTRFKVYTEYLQGLNNGSKSCYNFGLDIRNYQKLYKNFILANRLAYAHSDGSSEVEYLLGGVDNWFSPQKASNGNQAPGDNFGFQDLATPLRGYDQYARTGNNFLVFNTELRLPILTTFMKRPIQSAILRNLQLVAFVDMGDAWSGFLPDANSTNSNYTFPTPGSPGTGSNNVFLNLTVPNAGGLAMGYGAGLRTSLFGYFLRFDAAWNIEGIKTPVTYFALGTDF